jgi:flagellar protein FlaG
MNNNAKIGPAPPVTVAASGSSAGGDFSQSRSAEEAERAARYRLVIEEGARTGTFVYKTLDRVTGEVVRQLPREQIVKMLEAGEYASGAVIDTNA